MLTQFNLFQTKMILDAQKNQNAPIKRTLPPEIMNIVGHYCLQTERLRLFHDLRAFIALTKLINARAERFGGGQDEATLLAPYRQELQQIPIASKNELEAIQQSLEAHWAEVKGTGSFFNEVSLFKTYAFSPMGEMAKNGDLPGVTAFINRGVDVDGHNHIFKSALMKAASHGHAEIVTVLLKAGAQMDLTDEENKTALDYARENGQAEVVKLLESRSNRCVLS